MSKIEEKMDKYLRTDEGILPGKDSLKFVSAVAGLAAAGYIG